MTRIATAILLLFVCTAAFAEAPPAPAPAATKDEIERDLYIAANFFSMGDYPSAYERLTRAESLAAEHPGILYNMAVVLAKLQRYSESQARIDRYRQLFPEGAESDLLKQLEFALDFQRELQKKRQEDSNYMELFNRGKFLVMKGEFDEAMKIYQQAESQRPEDPAIAYNQAIAFEKRGEFRKATERLRRYLELQQGADDKSAIDAKIFALETEINDMQTKIVCPYCGHKLDSAATWCHRCWHGPYYVDSARWNSRACDSATRTTLWSDGRVARNEDLPCSLKGKTWREALRYTPTKQRAIQAARKAEGWTYSGDVLQSWADAQGNQVQLDQGDYLRRWASNATGEILDYEARKGPKGVWLLDREDLMIEGVRFQKFYTFDEQGRISQERVAYQNAAACNHLIAVTADYMWDKSEVASVRFRSYYDGYAVEGSPQVEWIGNLNFLYDASGKVEKEDFIVASAQKTYTQRPVGAMRDEVGRLYAGMRVKKPTDILRRGDLCFSAGSMLLGNPIDLRPFYTISPNSSAVLQFGSTQMTIAFTYPVGFAIRPE
jgi:Tfp pilus assembly protein PilF